MSQELWHYATGNAQHEPVSFQELRRLAAGGRISAEDLVWTPGMPEWVPARGVEGLISMAPVTAPVVATSSEPVMAGATVAPPPHRSQPLWTSLRC